MVSSPRPRQASALLTALAVSVLLAGAPAFAASLDEEACQRLRTERQALTVLGIDKTVEKGADWAKEKLTVADLNLVKRYFEVFEQLKFRCEKIVAAAEPEEKDDDDDEAGAAPPMPERKSARPASAPAAPPAKSGSAAFPLGTTRASAIQVGPARTVPVR
jgi:hypothetical protein